MYNQNSNSRHILVVDDEPLVKRSLSELLTLSGYTVSTADNGKDALSLLRNYNTDIVITDIKMPEMNGLELLRSIKKEGINTTVILITGYGSIESAVDAMKEGAYDYITKPIVDSEIKIILERLLKQHQLVEENLKLKEQVDSSQRQRFYNIVGKSPGMQKIYTLIEAISDTTATVLINGESGTGKRLIAHALHTCNQKVQGKPFIEVSCGALTETLLESELFGHVKGAFTGAIKDRMGRFELANQGTIFLDEIDAFSPSLQVKLLRVLQEGEFERVGDTKTIKVNVRIIAASNQKLQDLIAQGKFRNDLYYRLNIINIELPPLRQRKEDIPLLVNELINKHSKQLSKKVEGVSQEALLLLTEYDWPGNIRELENVIERGIILSKGPIITPEDFPEFLNNPKGEEVAAHNNASFKLKEALESPEKELILKALNSVGWNRNEAARILGINRTTLYKKMNKFGLLKDNSSDDNR